MDAPLALYRRYRPDSFADFVGQEHATGPLRAALANNRVNHAYLFSGPRGCGKTTAARIMARAMNCERAPLADPCGECDSCRDTRRGGPGSIDVIEIDAASHGGVDDARDLREKAFFAPVKSRYKVYIIDEAHMVTTQGFNALLKLVEEPPPHLRFIFATTEPEKIIPTIRSRTHHYPFRLYPPKVVSDYIALLCEEENIQVDAAALPLVVRAGGGSMRDTLSVMDQLVGGSGPGGLTYDMAVGLLGYTPDWLLDEVIDAFALADGAAVFGVVEKVIETGQDPRRFAEDLLRRLRDLVIIKAVPDAVDTGLIDVAGDQADRLVSQAARFTAPALSCTADAVANGLTEMRGATAPRLLLELICARVVVETATGSDGRDPRLARSERRLAVTSTLTAAASTQAQPSLKPSLGSATHIDEPATAALVDLEQDSLVRRESGLNDRTSTSEELTSAANNGPSPAIGSPMTHEPRPPQLAGPGTTPKSPAQGSISSDEIRRRWSDVVDQLMRLRRGTWALIGQNAQVVDFSNGVLTLGFPSQGLCDQFANGGHVEKLGQALVNVVGIDPRIEATIRSNAPSRQAAPPA